MADFMVKLHTFLQIAAPYQLPYCFQSPKRHGCYHTNFSSMLGSVSEGQNNNYCPKKFKIGTLG